MKNKSVLLVIDVQNDFCPGGSLAVPEGDEVIPVINELLPKFDLVIFTKDWHPEQMQAFASSYKNKKPFDKYKLKSGEEDTLWPDHCIQDTKGAAIHSDIKFSEITGDFYIFKKGLDKNEHPYSAFGAEGLEDFLNERGVQEVYVCGLATDYCVKETAIDASFKEFKSILIKDACKGISTDLSQTYMDLIEADVNIIESWELEMYKILK